MRETYRSVVKPLLDSLIAGILLAVLSPLLAAVAVAIKCTSRGPILFRQERIGVNERAFEMLKFRTMRMANDERQRQRAQSLESQGILLKEKADPRITPLGAILRRYSLDELPQLINVLRGEMSIVGPRPLMPFMFTGRQYERRLRCQVRPGLTGLWQVEARDACTSLDDMWDYDLRYLQTVSLREDLHLIVRTIPAIISGKGAC
jgi:lipopolysaccharide/colanic/teichoic acid biosynthesis glycosyltransferase